MGKKNRYNLDRSKISKCIENYCKENNYTFESIRHEKNPIHTVYKINNNSLRVYEIKDGSTTLDDSNFNNIIIKNELIEKIKTVCLLSNENNKEVVVKEMEEKDINLLLEYLEDSYKDNLSIDRLDNENETIIYKYRLKECIQGNQITLTYYKNKKFLIQGKPLILLFSVLSFLEDLELIDSMVDSVIGINKSFATKNLENLYPNIYNYLQGNSRKIFFSVFELRNTDIIFSEYSIFTFSVLRFLEFSIKDILYKTAGIEVKRTFNMFDGNTYELTIRNNINTNICNKLSEMYKYYKIHRITLFHTEQIDLSTRIIENRIDAEKLIDDVLELIEDCYAII